MRSGKRINNDPLETIQSHYRVYCSACEEYSTKEEENAHEFPENCASCNFYKYLKGEKKFLPDRETTPHYENGEISHVHRYSSNETVSIQRNQELKSKFYHAAREFGRICTKSNHTVPKEQQVSIDLGNKIIFNHHTQQLLQLPLTSKSASYIYEVGTKERIFGIDTTVKYFTQQEQDEHTRIPMMDESGEWRLHNRDGSVYDTTAVLNSGGRIMYAVSLDFKLITALEILADGGIEYACWHSSLLAAEPGLCFGSVVVENGKIVYISNHSGHYNPTAENLYNVVVKFIDLFTDDAALGVYFKRFDKDGTFWTNRRETKVLSEKFYCTVKDFVGRVEKGLPIIPGEDKMAYPDVYFERIRNWNERCKNFLIYKPVPVFNGNVVLAIEHSIRKLIGAGYGRKPSLCVDDGTGRVNVCFCDASDALKLESIIKETFEELNDIIVISNCDVCVPKRLMYEFIIIVLKINLKTYF